MNIIIVFKDGANSRPLIVKGVTNDYLKNGILRLERNGTSLYFNFDNILYYGHEDDVYACSWS